MTKGGGVSRSEGNGRCAATWTSVRPVLEVDLHKERSMGALLALAGLVGAFVFAFRAQASMFGKGERRNMVAAQAAYARLVREAPDDPEARLSEAEYVQRHMKKTPSAVLNWILAILCMVVVSPLGCIVMAAS